MCVRWAASRVWLTDVTVLFSSWFAITKCVCAGRYNKMCVRRALSQNVCAYALNELLLIIRSLPWQNEAAHV